jgi:hypothetical protein
MSWWIPAERMTNDWAVAPERLTLGWRDSFMRSAGLLGRLLRGLAGVSARMTRTFERAADRLEDAELRAGRALPLFPDEWLVADEDPVITLQTPPPIPPQARRPVTSGPTRFNEGEYPVLVTGPLMPSRGWLGPHA